MSPIEPVCSATWTPSLGKRHLRGDLLVKDWEKVFKEEGKID